MKKYILDFRLTENVSLHSNYSLMKFIPVKGILPNMLPGQFAEVRIDCSASTFLRRPISINYIDTEKKELWLLVRNAGKGTHNLISSKPGNIINMILPLGNSFSLPEKKEKILLIGGGVGVAPMLFWGDYLKEQGYTPNFLIGARTEKDLLELDLFKKTGTTYITTEDGSKGEKGFVTHHSILSKTKFDRIYCCGPQPMMISIAKYSKSNGIECEVSLENMMACGVGACLCCVEDTTDGHLCVCKEGPIFNIKKLKWEI